VNSTSNATTTNDNSNYYAKLGRRICI